MATLHDKLGCVLAGSHAQQQGYTMLLEKHLRRRIKVLLGFLLIKGAALYSKVADVSPSKEKPTTS